MGKKTYRNVYIYCLLQTLSAPLWSHLNPFSPAIQTNFESKKYLFTSQVQHL